MHELAQNSVEILSDYLKVNIESYVKHAKLRVRISRFIIASFKLILKCYYDQIFTSQLIFLVALQRIL